MEKGSGCRRSAPNNSYADRMRREITSYPFVATEHERKGMVMLFIGYKKGKKGREKGGK